MKRLITTLMILSMTVLTANASTEKSNTLNAIQIDSLKSTYNITLNTDTDVDVKRTIQSSDNMILTLKNIKPAKSLNTVYKNAAEVDSVMVEEVGSNALNISIKARNISNSAVNVEPEKNEVLSTQSVITPTKKHKKTKKESIELASPVDSYMPVYNDDIDDLDEEDGFAGLGLLAKIKNILSQGNISNIITAGLIGIILFCGIKLFKKDEPETVIGLTQSLKEREMNLYKDLSMNRGISEAMSLNNSAVPNFAPKEQPVTPVRPMVNANAGYGLRAYKSSSRNPYMSADNTMLQKSVTPQVAPQVASSTSSVAKPQMRTMSTVGSRVNNPINNNLNINRPVQNTGNSIAKASNIDSMKFLDSMAKIYEKNGRSDLAQGLKAGMLKAKADI